MCAMKRARPSPALTTTDKDRKNDTPPTNDSSNKQQYEEEKKKNKANVIDKSLSWSTFNVNMIPTKKSLHSSFQRHLSVLSAAQLHLNHQSTKETTKIQLLDLGCGDGRLSKELANNGFHVVGVDVNAEAVDMANERLHQCDEGGGGRAVVGDVTTIRLPEMFNCCLCQLLISVVGHVDQRRSLLNTVSHHLMPGGSLLLRYFFLLVQYLVGS